jgi:CheY-like chemotaxis protein
MYLSRATISLAQERADIQTLLATIIRDKAWLAARPVSRRKGSVWHSFSWIVRKIVEVVLRREGYEVLGFPDGIEALQWVTTHQA